MPPTVVITRPEPGATRLCRALSEAGLPSISLPVLRIERKDLEAPDIELVRQVLRNEFDWLVFTSSAAAQFFFEALFEGRSDGVLPPDVRIAAMSGATAEYCEKLWNRPVVSSGENGRELAEKISKARGAHVLYPCAERTYGAIEKELIDKGAYVAKLPVYRAAAQKPPESALTALKAVDPGAAVFTFFSPSAFRSTLAALGRQNEHLRKSRIACLGNSACEAAGQEGFDVFFRASAPSEDVFVRELADKLVITSPMD